MAFTHYLHAARLAQEPELAALAARAALALGDADAGQRAVDLWQELAPESVKARQIAAYVQIEAADRAGTLAALRELVRADTAGQAALHAGRAVARPRRGAGGAPGADAGTGRRMPRTTRMPSSRSPPWRRRPMTTRWRGRRPRRPRRCGRTGTSRACSSCSCCRRGATGRSRGAGAGRLSRRTADDRELRLLRAQLHIDAKSTSRRWRCSTSYRDAAGQPEMLFTAAVLALEVDELDQARGYLTSCALGRREDDVAFLLGQVEEQAGNADAALGWYAQVDGPNATDAAVRIARLHAARVTSAARRDMLQQLRDQMPEDAVTLFLIEGEMLRENDADQQAMAVYDQAIAARPDDPDLRYARAMVAVGLDRIDLLESDLRHILKQDPEHADALNALGYTLADRTDRLDGGARAHREGAGAEARRAGHQGQHGLGALSLGDPAAAEPYLRRPWTGVFDPEIAAHLGEVLWALGRKDEAPGSGIAPWRPPGARVPAADPRQASLQPDAQLTAPESAGVSRRPTRRSTQARRLPRA
jgi:tetratricopeptide (TPR) repeat protein